MKYVNKCSVMIPLILLLNVCRGLKFYMFAGFRNAIYNEVMQDFELKLNRTIKNAKSQGEKS